MADAATGESSNTARIATSLVLLASIGVVAALHLARDVLVPLALATLITFALTPAVLLLRRAGTPRQLAVIVVSLAALLITFALAGIVVRQAADLAQSLPRYEATLSEKMKAVRWPGGGASPFEALSKTLRTLTEDVGRAATPSPGAGPVARPGEGTPVPVEIRPAPAFSAQVLIGYLIQPLATAGVVVIAVIFMLMQREELRDRLIKLIGGRDLERTTTAMNNAAYRLSRFLLILTLINAGFGLVIGLGLWLIGVPNPALWGVCAALLRFIPYAGAVLAAVLPLALAAAVDPGWDMVLWTFLLFAVTEPLLGHGIEPWLQGRMTGLAPMAILLATIFWTWVWGPIGLILATPVTVLLVVIGRHVDSLAFLNLLLGDEPALDPEETLYQRLLANDPHEAAQQARAILKTMPLDRYFTEILFPALALAQRDLRVGALPRDRQVELKRTVDDLIEDIVEAPPPEAAPADGKERAAAGPEQTALVGVGGRSLLDTVAAEAVARLLRQRGITARILPPEELTASRIGGQKLRDAGCIYLSYLDPDTASAHLRFMVRRLVAHAPRAQILACLWNVGVSAEQELLAQTGETRRFDIARTVAEALEALPAPKASAEKTVPSPEAQTTVLDPEPFTAVAVAG